MQETNPISTWDTCSNTTDCQVNDMSLHAKMGQVERWKREWKHSHGLRLRFPSLATYLVYRASDSHTFQKARSVNLARVAQRRYALDKAWSQA